MNTELVKYDGYKPQYPIYTTPSKTMDYVRAVRDVIKRTADKPVTIVGTGTSGAAMGAYLTLWSRLEEDMWPWQYLHINKAEEEEYSHRGGPYEGIVPPSDLSSIFVVDDEIATGATIARIICQLSHIGVREIDGIVAYSMYRDKLPARVMFGIKESEVNVKTFFAVRRES